MINWNTQLIKLVDTLTKSSLCRCERKNYKKPSLLHVGHCYHHPSLPVELSMWSVYLWTKHWLHFSRSTLCSKPLAICLTIQKKQSCLTVGILDIGILDIGILNMGILNMGILNMDIHPRHREEACEQARHRNKARHWEIPRRRTALPAQLLGTRMMRSPRSPWNRKKFRLPEMWWQTPPNGGEAIPRVTNNKGEHLIVPLPKSV